MRSAPPDDRMTQRAFALLLVGSRLGTDTNRHKSGSAASKRRHVSVVREEEASAQCTGLLVYKPYFGQVCKIKGKNSSDASCSHHRGRRSNLSLSSRKPYAMETTRAPAEAQALGAGGTELPEPCPVGRRRRRYCSNRCRQRAKRDRWRIRARSVFHG
jgi:hypothetical protein